MKTALYKGKGLFDVVNSASPKLGPQEVKIQVAYCGICGTDRHVFHGTMDQRVGMDAVIGHEMSGKIIEIGSDVYEFAVGERVVVRPLDWCGTCGTCKCGHIHVCENLKFVGMDSPGAFQGEWVVKQRIIHRIPDSLSLRDASLVEPLAVAVHDVNISKVNPEDYTLIIGGGPIGLLIGLVLKSRGISCTISEINPDRLAAAQELGFRTIDPRAEDVADVVKRETGGSGADVIFEVSASQAGADLMIQAARPKAVIVVVGIFGNLVPIDLKTSFFKELTIQSVRVYEKDDFDEAIALLAEKTVPADKIISKVYPISQITKAFEQLDQDVSAIKILIDLQK